MGHQLHGWIVRTPRKIVIFVEGVFNIQPTREVKWFVNPHSDICLPLQVCRKPSRSLMSPIMSSPVSLPALHDVPNAPDFLSSILRWIEEDSLPVACQ